MLSLKTRAWFLETDLFKEQAGLKEWSSKYIWEGKRPKERKKEPLAIGSWKGKGEKEKFDVLQDKTKPQNWRA